MSKKGKCLVRGCQEPIKSRGLCSTHYQAAIRQIEKQPTTWEQLEAEGLAKPLRKTASRSPYVQAIEAIGNKDS